MRQFLSANMAIFACVLAKIKSSDIQMPQTFNCEKCAYSCNKLSNWDKHIKTRKHISEPNHNKFECRVCNYTTYNRSQLDRHKLTKKHKINDSQCSLISDEELPQVTKPADKPDSELMIIIKQLLTQNNELKNFIIEQANEHKKDTVDIITKVIEQTKSNTINGNITATTTNNNQKFNINLFLNETCKNAINFSDFIKNIEVSREDLENNAQLGFVSGVSKILIDSLKQLDKTERPIHCTDLKRETMYIKDDDKWNKEEDSSKLNKAIQEVTRKSMGTLMNWKEENPDYKDRDSEFSNRCIVIQQQSMAGYDRETYYPKVIKAVAKEIIIDKDK